jgi:hypothetical protein
VKLHSAVHDIGDLRPGDRDDMFRLMQRNYENVRRRKFEDDLDAKRWAIVVRTPSLKLVGFSTQVVLDARIGGARVYALYSGDTVVDREHWGDPALAHAWGNFALRLIEGFSAETLYWFLTSKGFRTYRYLPLFFRFYCPRIGISTPRMEQLVIDSLGRQVGGQHYDANESIIRAADGKDFVRSELGDPGLRLLSNPHVRFFVERNPGFEQGDELCCLAPLTRENFTRAAYRVIHRQSEPVKCV